MTADFNILDRMYAVIWCDSPRGLISFENYGDDDIPVADTRPPQSVPLIEDEDELFDILRRKDGTKVCLRYSNLQTYLGWTL